MTRHSKKHGGKSFLHKVKKEIRAMERRRDLAGLYFLNISDVIYSKCHALQGLRLGRFGLAASKASSELGIFDVIYSKCHALQGLRLGHFGLAASKASSELGISCTLGVKVHAQLLSLNTTKA